MGRPRQVSDEQILAVMRERVLAEGPAVSLDKVAEALDITGPALLKRFGSRKSLMLAALKPPENPEWIQHVQKGPGEAPLEAQLSDIFTRVLAFMGKVIPCMSVLRESGIPLQEIFGKRRPPEEGIKALQGWLKAAHAQGLVDVPKTEAVAFAILGALQTRAFFAHALQLEYSDRAQRAYVADLARFFTRALSP